MPAAALENNVIAVFANSRIVQEDSPRGPYYVVLCAAGAVFSSFSIVRAYEYAEWFAKKAP